MPARRRHTARCRVQEGRDVKNKVLAAVTAVLMSTAIGATFAAPAHAGTILPSQDKTATSPAAAAGSTPAYAGELCEGWGLRT